MLKPAKRGADKTAATSGEPEKKKFNSHKQTTGKSLKDKKNAFKTQAALSKHNGKDNNGKFSGPVAEEKKDWAKFKQEKKELKLKRKQSKDSYELTIEAKQIYEKLKCRKTEKKCDLAEKLYNLLSVGDTIKKIAMAHDTARILQCMLKFGTPSIRDQLSEKLIPHAVEMCQSKYSNFCILRMLKYGSLRIKSNVVDSLMGHIVRLSCHSISSKILDHIYMSVANIQQRSHMRQEFYGELYRKAKDNNVKTVADTYADSSNLKSSILGAIKSNLEHVANKQLIDNSLVHAVMLEYLQACDDDKLEEFLSTLAVHVPHMLSTKEGSQAATICFYKSTPKNRRAIVKNIKEHLFKIASHEHGHVFLVAVLNSLDDTKAIKKAIYDNLHDDLEKLVANQYGRRVVQWLVLPGDTNCFHPGFVDSIDQGLQYSKKDKLLRRKEVFEQIEGPIAQAIAQSANFWLSNSHIGLVTADLLKKLSSKHFVPAAEALTAIIVQPNWQVSVHDDTSSSSVPNKLVSKKSKDAEQIITASIKQKRAKKKFVDTVEQDNNDGENDTESNTHTSGEINEEQKLVSGIEDAGMHIVLKKIIKNDKDRATDQDCFTFGHLLLKQLSVEVLHHWLTVNRGCFILLNIIEQNGAETLKLLKEHFKDPNIKATLEAQKSKGAQLLAKKLNN